MHRSLVPSEPIMFIADAGPEAGLGHVSRSSALAVALRCRGVEGDCYARGSDEPFDCDGICWSPMPNDQPLEVEGGIVVVDSYRLPLNELQKAAESSRLVMMHDHGVLPSGTALVVSPASEPRSAAWLGGFQYVPLRPGFWGLPDRDVDDQVRRVLVTTGGGKFDEVGLEVAGSIASALPGAEVMLVRGPHARASRGPEGVVVLAALDSLLHPLLWADLVVTAGGQTMLEAAAAGTPSIGLALVDNQGPQLSRLSELRAVHAVDPRDSNGVVAAAIGLAGDAEARRDQSRRSQAAIDGYGALRVAFWIERLARRTAAADADEEIL